MRGDITQKEEKEKRQPGEKEHVALSQGMEKSGLERIENVKRSDTDGDMNSYILVLSAKTNPLGRHSLGLRRNKGS